MDEDERYLTVWSLGFKIPFQISTFDDIRSLFIILSGS